MEMNIALWIGGMLFSLGIFSVKVGFGLGFGRIRGRGLYAVLLSYLVLFVLLAVFSEGVMRLLAPALKRGPYLHVLMAVGMIAWGVTLVRTKKTAPKAAVPGRATGPLLRPALLLIIPCPVCLTAMTFSTWSALSVIALPPALVGLLLGAAFVVISLVLAKLLHLSNGERAEATLGVGMIGLGLYFITSLYLPAKIEEALGVYASFIREGGSLPTTDMFGIAGVLFAAFMAGYVLLARQGGRR